MIHYQIAQHQYLRGGSVAKKVFVNKTISPVKRAASARLVKMIEGSGIVKKARPIFVNKTISPIKKAMSARAVKAIEGSGVNRAKKFDKWTSRIGTATKAVAKFVKPVAQPLLQAATKRGVQYIENYNNPLGVAQDLYDIYNSGESVEPVEAREIQQYSRSPPMQTIQAMPYDQEEVQYKFQDEPVYSKVDRSNDTLYFGGTVHKKSKGRPRKAKSGSALYVAGARGGKIKNKLKGKALFAA